MPYYHWTRMPGAASPPPAEQTFDTISIAGIGVEDFLAIGQLYFGISGSGGGYSSNQTTFLAAHPGLTLIDFSGVAPPGGSAAIPVYAGITSISGGSVAIIEDSAVGSAPFCYVLADPPLTIIFSSAINAAGFFLASSDASPRSISYYDGITLLLTQIASTSDIATFNAFSGYAT